jgi:malate permease and related proteins
MAYLDALSKVIPIILLIVLGIIFNRTQFIQPTTIQEIKKLIILVTLPALLFLAFSRVDIQPQYLIIVALVFLACAIALILGHLLEPVNPINTPYFPFLMTGFEAGMMGYAIFSAVYGAENVYKFGIIDLGQVVFVFFVLVTALERLSLGPKPFQVTFVNFLKTPVILAIMAGIIFNQAGLTALIAVYPLGYSLMETLAFLGGLTTPLVAIVIGYEMHLSRQAFRKPGIAVGIRLLYWVPVGLLINYFIIDRLLNLDHGFKAAVLTMFILPPPFIIPLFMTSAEKRDRNIILNTLTLATLVTIVAFTIVTILYPP